ncbi:MAG: 6-phosphofructokinase [bacterium]|nr:6-phosphofructokinase [bacterium]
MKRIGVLTSGGDAPGMNAAIRAIVRTGIYHGFEIIGIMRGFEGLIQGEFMPMNLSSVSGILNRGGTILKSARSQAFRTKDGQQLAVNQIKRHNLDAIITIGGDGTSHGAHELAGWGVQVINVPSTIDNDLAGTDYTIGFWTAVTTALEAIDKIRDTATSYDRLFVVEVMGREHGYIALQTGLAGGAEFILVPEIPYTVDSLCEKLEAGKRRGKSSSIIVVAEGAGDAAELAQQIKDKVGYDTRYCVIGHLQRGGIPVAFDRILASRLGARAVELIESGETDKMVGIESNRFSVYPLPYSWQQTKPIQLELYNLGQILAT